MKINFNEQLHNKVNKFSRINKFVSFSLNKYFYDNLAKILLSFSTLPNLCSLCHLQPKFKVPQSRPPQPRASLRIRFTQFSSTFREHLHRTVIDFTIRSLIPHHRPHSHFKFERFENTGPYIRYCPGGSGAMYVSDEGFGLKFGSGRKTILALFGN